MPATKKTVKKTTIKKKVAPKQKEVTEQVETTPEVQETPVEQVETTPEVQESDSSSEPSLVESFDAVVSQLDTILASTKSLKAEVKRLQKRSKKEISDAQKSSKKRKSKQTGGEGKAKRAPSGFAKPSEISKSLCDFLGKPIGTEMARTEVTKYITQYIKNNNLQNPENKRHIIPDLKLGNLLNVQNNEVVTYFNLQKFMKHHFPKSAAALAKENASKATA